MEVNGRGGLRVIPERFQESAFKSVLEIQRSITTMCPRNELDKENKRRAQGMGRDQAKAFFQGRNAVFPGGGLRVDRWDDRGPNDHLWNPKIGFHYGWEWRNPLCRTTEAASGAGDGYGEGDHEWHLILPTLSVATEHQDTSDTWDGGGRLEDLIVV